MAAQVPEAASLGKTLARVVVLARHYIQVLCHANAYYPSCKQPHGGPRRVLTHPGVPPLSRRHRRPVLPHKPSLAACVLPRTADRIRPVDSTVTSAEKSARQPFRRGIAVGTTRQRQRPLHCLAQPSPGVPSSSRLKEPRLLLRPHSHSAAFESRPRPTGAPGTTPAAAELPALAALSAMQITSLSRVTGRGFGCMHGSPDPASFQPPAAVISEGRT